MDNKNRRDLYASVKDDGLTSFEYYIKKKESLQALKEECSIPRLSSKQLSAKYYSNSIVLKSKGWNGCNLLGGVQDSDGNFIANTCYGAGDAGSGGYKLYKNELKKKNKVVIFIGYLYPVWGHVISDALVKLWFLQTEECKNLVMNGAQIVYITEFNKPLPNWNKEIFSLAGYSIDDWIHITESTLFDKVIIPDDSMFYFNEKLFYTAEFAMTIDAIKKNVKYEGVLPEKVYYTRSAIKDTREWGREKNIELLFKKKGFVIISPEKYSVQCQIAMMMHCKEFAAPEGSCSHNSIFCAPGTIIYILRKADYINKYTSMIGHFAQLRTIYVDANLSTKVNENYPMLGPFYVSVTEELKRALGLNYQTFPSNISIRYWGGVFAVQTYKTGN